MRSKIVTSRKWHTPDIETFLTNDEVGASMPVDDFIQALVEEVGNPTMLLTKNALLAKLLQASIAVQCEMRQATAHVV